MSRSRGIYSRLISAVLKRTAKVYYYDTTSSTMEVANLLQNQPELFGRFDQFVKDCKKGRLAGEGVRIAPTIPLPLELLIRDLEFNYSGKFQQFFAPSSSTDSFLRWTVDLNHVFNLYSRSRDGLRTRNDLGFSHLKHSFA